MDVLHIRPARHCTPTVFEGSEEEGLGRDDEAAKYGRKHVPADHIINGNKHDNFWEMGDTGPCGPCSRSISIRARPKKRPIPGRELVNKDDPQVIEIWNLVFMQFNRKADGSLEKLSMNVIDTGMGFERLVRALQGKHSNYDTDIFQPIIRKIGEQAGKTYGSDEKDRRGNACSGRPPARNSFSIADGQIPGNAKAGYVIRRILRRAVRYAYTFLGQKEAFIYKLVADARGRDGRFVSRTRSAKVLIARVIREEEEAFLRTLATGINLLDSIIEETRKGRQDANRRSKGLHAFRYFRIPARPYGTNLLRERLDRRRGRVRPGNAETERTCPQCCTGRDRRLDYSGRRRRTVRGMGLYRTQKPYPALPHRAAKEADLL